MCRTETTNVVAEIIKDKFIMFYRLYDTVAEIIKAVKPLYIDLCGIDMEKRPHMRCLIDFM